jgi:uncharacterized phiE125 gp8 family phage protein
LALYGLALITAPTLEPLSLSDAKVQCGVAQEVSYHDDALTSWIVAARRKVETDTGRALVNQTWDMSLDCWPLGLEAIYLPKAPLVSVTSVKYYDTAAAEQTLATTYYKVIAAREPGEIRLKHAQSWPSLYSEASVITIRFVAGYGATAASVPDGLKAAMKLLIANWFENPSATITGTTQAATEFAYQSLIDGYLVGDEFHSYAG